MLGLIGVWTGITLVMCIVSYLEVRHEYIEDIRNINRTYYSIEDIMRWDRSMISYSPIVRDYNIDISCDVVYGNVIDIYATK